MTTLRAVAPSGPSRSAECEIRDAWQAYQAVEKRGLDFGRVCYEQRAKAEVVQGGTTFSQTLDKLKIPRRTAYYWIQSYEISIGVRELERNEVLDSAVETDPIVPEADEGPQREIVSESPEIARERRRFYDEAGKIEASIVALFKKHRIQHYRSINLTLSYEHQSVTLQILPSRKVAAKNQLFSPHATPRCS